MRSSKLLILLMVLILPLAVACGREGAETQNDSAADVVTGTSEQEVAGVDANSATDVSPVTAEMAIDDVTVGGGLAQDGTIATEQRQDDFTPGQDVFVAMNVGDVPAGSVVKVAWYADAGSQTSDTAAAGDATTDKGGTKVGEETKTVTAGQPILNFKAPSTGSWKKGDYRVEVWYGDEKVAEEQFQIVDQSDAAT
jgi:Tfp pilus assembly protein PilZ